MPSDLGGIIQWSGGNYSSSRMAGTSQEEVIVINDTITTSYPANIAAKKRKPELVDLFSTTKMIPNVNWLYKKPT